MEVPAYNRLIIEVKAMDVDCPYDFVQVSTNISPHSVTLCPVSSVFPGWLKFEIRTYRS